MEPYASRPPLFVMPAAAGAGASSRRSRKNSPSPARKKAGKGMSAALPILLLAVLAAGAFSMARKTPSFPKKFIPVPAAPPHKTPAASGNGQAAFSRIDIRTVGAENGGVRIGGSTDLPDGALLSVDFDIAGPPGAESGDAVSTTATVRGGAFSARVVPPGTRAFAHGPYRVDVLFSPRAQDSGVLGKVGADGERLAGEHARETFGFRVLEVTKTVDIRLAP